MMTRVVRFSPTLIVGLTLSLVLAAGRATTGQAPSPGNPEAGAVKNPEAAKVQNPVPVTPESVGAGQKLFEKNCVQCHGWDGTGGPPASPTAGPDLTDEEWKNGGTDGEIFHTIRNGVPPDLVMVAWKDFSDTDIWNIVNYIRSLRVKK